jgi:hypothetical protein
MAVDSLQITAGTAARGGVAGAAGGCGRTMYPPPSTCGDGAKPSRVDRDLCDISSNRNLDGGAVLCG